MKRMCCIFLVTGILTAMMPSCTPTSASSNTAAQTLVAFFDLLNKSRYAEADALYGGDYETLMYWNPDLNPSDHAVLWEHGCRINGLQCLTVRSAALKDHHNDTYIFLVEFNRPDGSLFVRGPCCGATETEMPSQSVFPFTVGLVNGNYKVITMPVYVP